MLKQLVVLCAIAASVMCRHTPSNLNALYSEQISEKTLGSDDKATDDGYMTNWDITAIYNSVKNYTNSDISVYLKTKLLTGLESATRGDLDLGGGIRLVRDASTVDANEPADTETLRNLPRGLGDKEDALTSMIWKKINKLLRTHTMQVSSVLRSVENKLKQFVRYIWSVELPSFILDVMEYKVAKFKTPKKKKKKKHKRRQIYYKPIRIW